MKFSAALFATGALAALAPRDVQTITDAINSISEATSTLNDALPGFDGSPDAILSLQSNSEALINAITEGTASVEPTDPIEVTDALQLQPLIEDLGTLVDETINNVIAARDQFDEAGISSIVADQLNQQQAASIEFSDTVTSKVPEAIQGVAQQLSAPILDALQRGVDAYADAEEGGSSPSASASETTAPTATATETEAEETATETEVVPTSEPTAMPTETEAPETTAAPTASETGASEPTSSTPADYNPNSGLKNSASFGAIAMAGLVAVAAF